MDSCILPSHSYGGQACIPPSQSFGGQACILHPVMDLSNEIQLQTTRSGGKGGQNVNKVETAVIGYFNISDSLILTNEQKHAASSKLKNRINSEGQLVVRSQSFRTQLDNKADVIRKINELITESVKKKKARIATRPSKQAKRKRLEDKKRNAERKGGRGKIDLSDM